MWGQAGCGAVWARCRAPAKPPAHRQVIAPLGVASLGAAVTGGTFCNRGTGLAELRSQAGFPACAGLRLGLGGNFPQSSFWVESGSVLGVKNKHDFSERFWVCACALTQGGTSAQDAVVVAGVGFTVLGLLPLLWVSSGDGVQPGSEHLALTQAALTPRAALAAHHASGHQLSQPSDKQAHHNSDASKGCSASWSTGLEDKRQD